ncbi:acyl carrier protein [Kitasatospora sp. NPDC004669]|uniref:acyl carrier protein n=1 Tax=Kitasatospora sp. NPDC004669 TaxID=3154555 RepID=UPI0033B1D6E0
MTTAATTTEIQQAPIAEWLREKVAFYLEEPVDSIRTDTKLAEYGLDSLHGLTLCGEIEDEFGIEVEPTLVWDYPTIEALSGLLVEMLAGNGDRPA